MFINRLKLWYSHMQKLKIKTKDDCLELLKKNEILYKLHEHDAAFNM